jgi:hypothetical protein
VESAKSGRFSSVLALFILSAMGKIIKKPGIEFQRRIMQAGRSGGECDGVEHGIKA